MTTHAGLFEGIGGFTIGAQRNNIETKWVCELDPYRRKVLKNHFKNAHQYRDIRHLHHPPPVDILTGGFPCQNISVAGSRTGIFGDQSKLWAEYFRIIEQCRPRYVVIENSIQLRRSGLEVVLYDLSKIGYDAQWESLQAADFGYPHKRERLFIVAYPHEERRWKNGFVHLFRPVDEVFGELPGQAHIPVPIKRYHPSGNTQCLPISHGLSSGLDRPAIAAIGDAVLPDIADYIFKCILKFDSLTAV